MTAEVNCLLSFLAVFVFSFFSLLVSREESVACRQSIETKPGDLEVKGSDCTGELLSSSRAEVIGRGKGGANMWGLLGEGRCSGIWSGSRESC